MGWPSLTSEVSDGNREGFEEFAVGHARLLLRVALNLTHDRSASEDLVQETLMRALEKWQQVSGAQDPQRYLFRMLVNLYLAGKRSKGKGRVVPLDMVQATLRDPVPDHGEVTATRLALAQAIRDLPKAQRTVLVLHHYLDLEHAEIAQWTSTSERTVRSNLSRAHKTLRALLAASNKA